MVWKLLDTPLYVFMVWCLVKHKENFTFYLSPPFLKLYSFPRGHNPQVKRNFTKLTTFHFFLYCGRDKVF